MRLLTALTLIAAIALASSPRGSAVAKPPPRSPAQLFAERGLRLDRSHVTPMAEYDSRAGRALRFVYEASSKKPLRKDQAWKLIYELRLAAEQFKHDTPVLVELFLLIDANTSTDQQKRDGLVASNDQRDVPFWIGGRHGQEMVSYVWKDTKPQIHIREGKNVRWYAWATSFRPFTTKGKRHEAAVESTGKWLDRMWWADTCCHPPESGRAPGGLPVEVK